MGLDQNIFRISRTHYDLNKVYQRSEVSGGILIDEEDAHESSVQQIIPYCQKVRFIDIEYDYPSICRDYDLADDARPFLWNGNIVAFQDGNRKKVEVPASKINEKYTIYKTISGYACNAQEVNYWRKNYLISDWFHEHISVPVENCGYYILNEELIDEFNEAFPDEWIEPEDPADDSALVYWEWY